MARRKIQHFTEMKTWAHVHEPDRRVDAGLRGSWGQHVELELGCGRGDFIVGLAERQPLLHGVGVDVKGARMWHGAQAALARMMPNVSFLRARIEDLLLYFNPAEVDTIWLTFPDPQLRVGRSKKRLTSPRFLNIYRSLLKEHGRLKLKTDSQVLFDYSVEVLEVEHWHLQVVCRDLHASEMPETETAKTLLTQYERRYLSEGKPIFYLEALPV